MIDNFFLRGVKTEGRALIRFKRCPASPDPFALFYGFFTLPRTLAPLRGSFAPLPGSQTPAIRAALSAAVFIKQTPAASRSMSAGGHAGRENLYHAVLAVIARADRHLPPPHPAKRLREKFP